ncbi:hypothetical protein L0244_05835 [bacterium]|nr:hypothetical protein [bacterium]
MGKMVISVIVIFVLSMGFGFLIHEILLKADYDQVRQLFRTEEDGKAHFIFLVLGQLLFSIGFVWIYNKGKEAKPFLEQGIRYGIAIAVLAGIPMFLIYYAIQPLPGMLVVKQIIFESIGVIIRGIVVAALNK